MNPVEEFAAPELDAIPTSLDKWELERQAFLKLLPDLLRTLRGQYVAVHEGNVLESGDDKVQVGLRAYAKVGYVPIYVGLVSEEPVIWEFPRDIPGVDARHFQSCKHGQCVKLLR